MSTEYRAGNRLILLNSNAEYLPALLSAVAEAQHEIFLESYIFANDPTGHVVAATLEEAARRGVTVRVLVDGFGASNFARDFLPRLTAASVQAMIYRPEVARFRLRRHRLRRLHRKLAIIDGRIAFVGGINIIDDKNVPARMKPRFDYAVQVEGPVLFEIHAAMVRMWEIVAWVNFRGRFHIEETCQPTGLVTGNQEAAFLIRDNFRHRNAIANAYDDAIETAREEIIIANAYFLPGIRFRRALVAAVQRDVRVTILLQGRSDHKLVQYATQALYGAMLVKGIRVFEYRRSFLHAKVAVIDQHWATVGSSNIDPLSLLLSKEANLFIRDKHFAGQLHASLLHAMEDGAVEIHPHDLKKMSRLQRLRCWLSYALVRLLLGLAGYDPSWLPHADES
ncbi:MAG: Phospholipase D/Transphosphatidylase [Proteobacteria bacterium]|nr:Phospholipase D/Transphosphatidylase [Pseudomonadota bacterium]